jgi:hypothetical protein
MVLTFLGSLESVSKACIRIHWTVFKIKESISTLSMNERERERERERGSRKYTQLEVLLILQTTLKNENQSF